MRRKEQKFKTSQKLKMLPNVFKKFWSGHSELDLSGYNYNFACCICKTLVKMLREVNLLL
jgi:hypothetical protein